MTAEVYIAKNQDGISFSDNEGFTIDVNETIGKYLVSFNPSTLIDVMSPSAGWNKEAIFSTDLWYVIDNKQTDGKTAIMYRFSLTREDFGYVIFVYG